MTSVLRGLAVAAILTATTGGATGAADAPKLPLTVDEVDALRIENLGLKAQIVQTEARRLQAEGARYAAEQQAAAKAAAERAGLVWDEVDLDLGRRLWTAKPKPPKNPAAEQGAEAPKENDR